MNFFNFIILRIYSLFSIMDVLFESRCSMLKAILFDLDGTLLPMDQEKFIKHYLGGMARKMAPHGYDPQLLAKAVWAGTSAMVANDGSETNENLFWNCFTDTFGQKARADVPIFNEFYYNEFQQVKDSCGFTPLARQCIDQIRAMGLRTILATNPLFPAVATHTRVQWAGLQPEDFELITTYETSRHCKPNPDYYRDILEQQGLEPWECLMVGNDATEDVAAQEAGIPVFLLTHCLINRQNRDISQWPNGSFEDLMTYIQELKA